MDCETYRHSGELSDITVSVDGQDFHLHKFPLFVRSNFFKNHPQLQAKDGQMAPAVAHIILSKFPGGSKTFSTIADYCYNKGVNVNHDNVVEVRSAAEYLEMTGNNGSQCCRGGLATLADNVLFEQLHTAKARRDYTIPLDLLERTRPFREHADKSGITNKLVESFIDNLAHNGRSNAYDGYRRDHTGSLNSVILNENQLATLNELPLNTMNDLIKQAARSGVNHSLLSHIVQSYIDHNTGLNPKSASRPEELISIASAILKADSKLSKLSTEDNKDDDEPKPLNLISIAGELKKKEGQEAAVSSIADAIKESKDDSSSSSDDEPDLKLVANLVNIATELKAKDEKSGSSKPSGGASNLIDIAADILKPGGSSSQARTDEDRLKIIKTLIGTLADLRIEPDFTLPWLLTYMSGLQKLKADEPTKSKFNKWAWEAFHDPRSASSNSADLKNVPPEVMIQFARDISDKAKDRDIEKLADLIDRYMTDLDKDNKLDLDTAVKLASVIPKDKRKNFDPLTVNLVNAYSKSPNKSDKKLNEVLDHTDFSKLNEKTLDHLNNNPNVPSKKVADAALALAHRLRKELDEYKLLHKPSSSHSSSHYPSYTDHYDIKPSSSRPHYNKYDKPFTSTYDCASTYYPTTNFKSSIRSRSGDIKSNKLTYPTTSSNYSSRTPHYSSYNNDDCESYSYHYHSVDNNSVDRHDIKIVIDEQPVVSNNDVQESIYFSTRTRVY